jgi:hypothetical protein
MVWYPTAVSRVPESFRRAPEPRTVSVAVPAPPRPTVKPWIDASKVETRCATTAFVAARFEMVPRLVMFGWAGEITDWAVPTVDTLLPLMLLRVFPKMSVLETSPKKRLLAFKFPSVFPKGAAFRPTMLLA